jgi:toxin-antitoxin system PIN domain toxin
MRALLDVNVLIALLDASHAFHARAHDWWSAHARYGWAGCPLTENGAVRIMSNPAYSKVRRFLPAEIIAALAQFARDTDHQFWPDSVSLRDPSLFAADRIHGHRQLTDLYLLALAAVHEGCLATFDASIPLSAVKTAGPANLIVI